MIESLQVDVMILKENMKEIKVMHGKCKERQSEKCISFKNRSLLFLEDTLNASNEAIKAKKKAVMNHRNY